MILSDNERKAMLHARLRNLKRRYVKLCQHADLAEEAIETKAEIDSVERELNQL